MPAALPYERTPSSRPRRGAIGLLSRGIKYLLIRRAEGILKGGYWCFPGGHVERGETSRQAVQREFHEELGITVQAVERLGSVRVLDTNHVLAVWTVRHLSGEIHPADDEIADVRWLAPAEIRAITPGVPSNEEVLDLLGV